MFGYVTIYHKGLEKPELDRYQAYYCGLCRTLGQKYGLPGQLTLSYDLAFIAILHSALYEPETQFYRRTVRAASHQGTPPRGQRISGLRR